MPNPKRYIINPTAQVNGEMPPVSMAENPQMTVFLNTTTTILKKMETLTEKYTNLETEIRGIRSYAIETNQRIRDLYEDMIVMKVQCSDMLKHMHKFPSIEATPNTFPRDWYQFRPVYNGAPATSTLPPNQHIPFNYASAPRMTSQFVPPSNECAASYYRMPPAVSSAPFVESVSCPPVMRPSFQQRPVLLTSSRITTTTPGPVLLHPHQIVTASNVPSGVSLPVQSTVNTIIQPQFCVVNTQLKTSVSAVTSNVSSYSLAAKADVTTFNASRKGETKLLTNNNKDESEYDAIEQTVSKVVSSVISEDDKAVVKTIPISKDKEKPLFGKLETTPVFGRGVPNFGTVGGFSFNAPTSVTLQTPVISTATSEKVNENVPHDGADEADSESEEDNIHFDPIIPLPDEVPLVTGEEDEIVLYEHRAKLYRFVDSDWKERGLGIIKILHHTQSGKIRLLMRREVILNICLNHYIFADFNLKEKSDRSYVWSAPDFSDGVVVNETFAILFKTADIARDFKLAVDNAVEEIKKLSSTLDNSPVVSETSDDVKFLCETEVSEEEKLRAEELKLPAKFFSYKYNGRSCSGCVGCENEQDETIFSNKKTDSRQSNNKAEAVNNLKDSNIVTGPPKNQFIEHIKKLTTTVHSDKSFDSAKGGDISANKNSPLTNNFNNGGITGLASELSGSSLFGNEFSRLNFSNNSFVTPSDVLKKSDGDLSPASNTCTFTSPFTSAKVNNSNNPPRSSAVTLTPIAKTASGNIFDGKITSAFPKTNLFSPLWTNTITPTSTNKPSISFPSPISYVGDVPSKVQPAETSEIKKKSKIVLKPASLSSSSVMSLDKSNISTSSISDSSFSTPTSNTSSSIVLGDKNAISTVITTPPSSILDLTSKLSVTSTKENRNDTKTSVTSMNENTDTTTKTLISKDNRLFGNIVSTANVSEDRKVFGNTAALKFGSKSDFPSFSSISSAQSVFGSSIVKTDVRTDVVNTVSSDNVPKFLFSPKDPDLSFAALASKESKTFQPATSGFSWPGAGTSIFKTTTSTGNTSCTEETNDTTERDDTEEYDPYYEPIVPLPDIVEVKTGEEDEQIMFCSRAKLYRLDNKEWKERGVGEMKILHNASNGTFRLILRREQVFKVVLNQRLFDNFILEKMATNVNSWCWAGLNMPEEQNTPVMETLAVRFKTEELANRFRDVIDSCIMQLKSI